MWFIKFLYRRVFNDIFVRDRKIGIQLGPVSLVVSRLAYFHHLVAYVGFSCRRRSLMVFYLCWQQKSTTTDLFRLLTLNMPFELLLSFHAMRRNLSHVCSH